MKRLFVLTMVVCLATFTPTDVFGAKKKKKNKLKLNPTQVLSVVHTTYSYKGKDFGISCFPKGSKMLPGKLKGNKFSLTLKKLKTKRKNAKSKKKKKAIKSKIKAIKAACNGGGGSGGGSLAPYTQPLTLADISHLYEKAAYGAYGNTEKSVGLSQGAGALVDHLMTVRGEPSGMAATAIDYLDEQLGEDNENVTKRGIQLYALYRMLNTNNPFFERLAFRFLHNMLATSIDVLSSSQRPLMFNHLEIIRAASRTGDYRKLVADLTIDPTMLIWLDGALNTVQEPNENYARELMELFTLGPKQVGSNVPNYSETTVAQTARAMTGWTVIEVEAGWTSAFSVINFDTGNKTVFEGRAYQSVVSDHRDMIDTIFDKHPESARYLAYRIAKEYLNPDPPIALVNGLASTIKANNYNILPAIKRLLKSQAFYSSANRDSIIKTPVDRMLELARRLKGSSDMPFDFIDIQRGLEDSGQVIGAPPTVFGRNNDAWTNGQWLLNLTKTVTKLVRDDSLFNAQSTPWTYHRLFPPGNSEPEDTEMLSYFEEVFGVALTGGQQSVILDYMNNNRNSDATLSPAKWDARVDSIVRRKVAGLVEIFFRLPQFQLR